MSLESKSAVVKIKVATKTSRSKITIDENGEIKVFLNSPPVDGKANLECIKLFSKLLKISKSNVEIETGLKSKNKKLKFKNISSEYLWKKLKEI